MSQTTISVLWSRQLPLLWCLGIWQMLFYIFCVPHVLNNVCQYSSLLIKKTPNDKVFQIKSVNWNFDICLGKYVIGKETKLFLRTQVGGADANKIPQCIFFVLFFYFINYCCKLVLELIVPNSDYEAFSISL